MFYGVVMSMGGRGCLSSPCQGIPSKFLNQIQFMFSASGKELEIQERKLSNGV